MVLIGLLYEHWMIKIAEAIHSPRTKIVAKGNASLYLAR
jgi:hypothetical protein